MKNLVIAASMLLPVCCLAWGPDGHSIVAELGERTMSAEAREIMRRDILPPGVSLASISSWADAVVNAGADGQPATMVATKPWHFVDMPLQQTRYDESVCPDMKGAVPNKCVVKAIAETSEVLRDSTAPKAKRYEALKFLVHFVGDIHQPLHTVSDDFGGNGFLVRYCAKVDSVKGTCIDYASKRFHSFWDEGMLQVRYYAWGTLMDDLLMQWGDDLHGLPADSCASAQNVPACWAEESHRIAASAGFYAKDHPDLDTAYYEKHKDEMKLQLARAGSRLGRTLDSLMLPK